MKRWHLKRSKWGIISELSIFGGMGVAVVAGLWEQETETRTDMQDCGKDW